MFLLMAMVAVGISAKAQEGEAQSPPAMDIFYGTRTVNLHTVKQVGKKVLSYRISHRLGDVDGGLYQFFGIDGPASVSLAFDYGISDKLGVGIARHSLGKIVDGYVKYSILRQTEDNSTPLSLGVVGRANLTYIKDGAAGINGFSVYDNFANRMSYFTQVMVARKFGDRLGVQVAPIWVHQNLVQQVDDKNDIFGVALQANYKFTKTLGVSGEYCYNLNDYTSQFSPAKFRHSAGLGLDIVTGGHIFQIVLVNSFDINESRAIPYTQAHWLDGKFRIGFNIARSFWL